MPPGSRGRCADPGRARRTRRARPPRSRGRTPPTSCPATGRARACAGRDPPAEVRDRVRREHAEQDGERREARVLGEVAHQDREREAEPDPRRAEHGRADRHRRRRARLGDPVQEERERSVAMKPPSIQTCPPSGRRPARARRPRSPRARSAAATGPSRELVQREHGRDRDQPDEPPAARARRGRARPAGRRAQRRGETRRRSSAAEAATAARVRVERGRSRPRRSRARACRRRRLRVGELPEQEVRDPELARRADHEVRLGQLGRVEVGGEELLVDLVRRDAVATIRRAASTISPRPP